METDSTTTITKTHDTGLNVSDIITYTTGELNDGFWVCLLCWIIRCRLPKKKFRCKVTEASETTLTMDKMS